uniref:uncharacterized protein LOC132669763 n=1 Tax=Panthera onca TaxID=9690 RepID=UPI0029550168|nr:uncharacterized protein LOC132669763 [Panthera onca]
MTKKSPGGCRGSNVPRVTRGQRRCEGIPGTAFLQVNPGWAIPPRGCRRPEREGIEAVAASSSFPWLTSTPAGATATAAEPRSRSGAVRAPSSPRPRLVLASGRLPHRRPSEAELGKRGALVTPGLGPRSPHPGPWETPGLWPRLAPTSIHKGTGAGVSGPALNFHPGRAPTQKRRFPGDVTCPREGVMLSGRLTYGSHFASVGLPAV